MCPPTHFYTNEFSWIYQVITNTYGVPGYKEANPALFTSITFPFLFGVMFGDIGHGAIILMVGVFLCLIEGTLR